MGVKNKFAKRKCGGNGEEEQQLSMHLSGGQSGLSGVQEDMIDNIFR